MASSFNLVVTFFCMLSFCALVVDSAVSQKAAQAPAVDCNNIILNLADCLSFVTNGSTIKKPEGTCCSGLKMVLKTDAQCLCEGFKNSAQLGVVLNVTKAMALPDACHVSAPSVSNCGLSIDTGAAPALSPVAVSPTTAAGASEVAPAGTPTTAAAASEVAPVSSRPGSSSAASLGLSVGTLTLTLAAAFVSWF